jgi:hypothetical protein
VVGSRRGGRARKPEDALRVAVQDQVCCLVIELEAVLVLQAVGGGPGRVVACKM